MPYMINLKSSIQAPQEPPSRVGGPKKSKSDYMQNDSVGDKVMAGMMPW